MIYLAPVGAGLLTVSAFTGLVVLVQTGILSRGPLVESLTTLVPIGNVLLGACVSAYAVARLHPVHQGRWWRAGAAFLFALFAGAIATVGWFVLAEVAVVLAGGWAV